MGGALDGQVEERAFGPARQVLERSHTSELRLLSVVLGALVSYMAIHQIEDRNEAIDALLKDLYAHYTEVARKRQITFDEFLAQRVALKSREYGTANNAPGLVDNLKQDYADEGAEAYRRASRGW